MDIIRLSLLIPIEERRFNPLPPHRLRWLAAQAPDSSFDLMKSQSCRSFVSHGSFVMGTTAWFLWASDQGGIHTSQIRKAV
jgi:hypothetical protein